MSTRSLGWKCGVLALVMIGTVVARQDPQGAPDVLTRGPIHEAYAEPVVFDPTLGVVIPKPPPDPIEEQPPDQVPEGNDVQWISGYWAWDDERGDFLWVSGIWRDIPPGRQWMPGYWSEVAGGFQWTSGFWAPVEQEEVEYLPTPPQTLEVGPNTPAPSVNHIWAPGYWNWRDERYVWAPGYWIEHQTNWIWTPPTYVATPSGCIFVAGYWDYTLANRGLLFAPVYFQPVVYTQPQFVYTPTVTIDSYVLTDHFFCRPNYRHYYFGDYYAARAPGIEPWFAYQERRTWYDPIYAHTRVVSIRDDPGWETRVRESYHYRIEHEDARPPRTFVAQQALVARRQDADVRPFVLARTLAQAQRAEQNRIRFERVDRARQAELAQRQQELQRLRERRARLEAEAQARRAEVRERATARKQAMPKSPIAARAPRRRAAEDLTGAQGGGPGSPPPGLLDRPGRARPDLPKAQPRPERTKAQREPFERPPGLDLPKAQPRPERTKAQREPFERPPGLDLPKAQPKRELPRDLPKAERPRPTPKAELPKAERPRPIPKAELPKAERPRPIPKIERIQPPSAAPGLDLPRVQPNPVRPRDLPKAERPKAQPKVERPKAQPKRERSKDQGEPGLSATGRLRPIAPLGSVPPAGPARPRVERPAARPRIEARSGLANEPASPRQPVAGPRLERLRNQNRPGIEVVRPTPTAPAVPPRLARPELRPAPRLAPRAQPGAGARSDRLGAARPGLGQPARSALPKAAESPKTQRKLEQRKRDREG